MGLSRGYAGTIPQRAKTLGRKEETRQKILHACSYLLRRNGVKGATVAKVMKRAGLTVGGFYAHFESKDAMVAEGFRFAMEQSRAHARSVLSGESSAEGRMHAFLREYLSPGHRDQDRKGQGCPMACLATEIGKGPTPLLKAFSEECNRLATDSTKGFSDEQNPLGKKEFLAILSTYLGGLILARATRGSPISDEILEACLARLGAGPSNLADRNDKPRKGD